MNKKALIVTCIVLFIVVAMGIFAYRSSRHKPTVTTAKQTNNAPSPTQLKTACDIYSIDIAKQYLGENAKLGDTKNSDEEVEGENKNISSCLYEDGAEIPKIINIGLHTAKNDAGKQANQSLYDSMPKEVAELENKEPTLAPIDDLGDKAYWNPDTAQVVVLAQNGNYLLIVQGSLTKPESKAESEALARDLANQL